MSVVSNLLAATSFSDALEHDLYTTPAGRRTIVKSIQVTGAAGAASHATFTVKNGSTGLSIFLADLGASGANGQSAYLFPWVVLPPGYRLSIKFSASGGWVTVSGSELVL